MTIILRELYDQDEVDKISNFAFISCDPVDFDEGVKRDVWIK